MKCTRRQINLVTVFGFKFGSTTVERGHLIKFFFLNKTTVCVQSVILLQNLSGNPQNGHSYNFNLNRTGSVTKIKKLYKKSSRLE